MREKFDYFFTSSLVEKNLIKKKFPEKKIFLIGYSRFNNYNNLEQKNIIEEFNFDASKKNIYCSPSEWIMSSQDESSIIKYILFLKILNKNFNLILRPHPKLKFTSPRYFKLLEESGLKLA